MTAEDSTSVLDSPLRPVRRLGARVRAQLDWSSVGIFVLLALEIVVFSVLSPNFLTSANFYNVILSSTNLALVAAGMTLVILIGGIDISVGSVLAVTAWITGTLTVAEAPAVVAVAAAVAVGGAIGAVHGTVVSRFRVSPIIMSIGFLVFWRAVHVTLWGGDDLFAPPVTLLISQPIGGVPGVTYLVVATFIVLWFVTTQTRFGRYIYAIGNDEQSAYQAGVPVRRVRTLTYAALGMLVGVASVIFMARTGVIQAFSGQGLELQAIAAAVVGGTAITGGRGKILSTLGGVLFVAFLENGIVLLGVADFWVEFLLGVLILAAVAVDARLRGVDMEVLR